MGHSNSPPACCMTCSYKPGRHRPVSLLVLAICVMLCCIVALGRNNQALSVSIFTGCHESREESICTYASVGLQASRLELFRHRRQSSETRSALVLVFSFRLYSVESTGYRL